MTPLLRLAGDLERIVNRYLQLDPDTAPRLAALSGKAIAVEPVPAPGKPGPDLTLYLLPDAKGLRISDAYAGDPDVTIRGTPLGLAGWLRDGAEVELVGDAELARAFRHLFQSVDIDWEEHLSYWLSDPIAHQIGNLVRSLQTWGRRATDTLRQDAAEYLQYEARDLPPRWVVEDFLEAVDGLRAEADQLESRIRRLQQALANRS